MLVRMLEDLDSQRFGMYAFRRVGMPAVWDVGAEPLAFLACWKICTASSLGCRF